MTISEFKEKFLKMKIISGYIDIKQKIHYKDILDYTLYFENNCLIVEDNLGNKKIFDISLFPRIYIQPCKRYYRRRRRLRYIDFYLYIQQDSQIFTMDYRVFSEEDLEFFNSLITIDIEDADYNLAGLSALPQERAYYDLYKYYHSRVTDIKDTSKNIEIKIDNPIGYYILTFFFLIHLVITLLSVLGGIFIDKMISVLLIPSTFFSFMLIVFSMFSGNLRIHTAEKSLLVYKEFNYNALVCFIFFVLISAASFIINNIIAILIAPISIYNFYILMQALFPHKIVVSYPKNGYIKIGNIELNYINNDIKFMFSRKRKDCDLPYEESRIYRYYFDIYYNSKLYYSYPIYIEKIVRFTPFFDNLIF